MKCWIDPSIRVLNAAMQLALKYPTRIINHKPFDEDKNRTCWTPTTARAARALRKPQQLAIPETYDDELGR